MRTTIPRGFTFTNCFVCGPDNARGLHLVFERDDDEVLATFTPPLEYGGYGTILHGGLTSTLLDEAMAWAVYGLLDRLSLTKELRVRFLGPLRCGEELTVTGSIVSFDRDGAETRAAVKDPSGVVRAEGTGVMRFVSSQAVERLAGPG